MRVYRLRARRQQKQQRQQEGGPPSVGGNAMVVGRHFVVWMRPGSPHAEKFHAGIWDCNTLALAGAALPIPRCYANLL